MCTTVYGRASDGEFYEIYSCAELAEAFGCKLQELVQYGEHEELEPDYCLCNVDVEASAEKCGKSLVSDGVDYELLEDA